MKAWKHDFPLCPHPSDPTMYGVGPNLPALRRSSHVARTLVFPGFHQYVLRMNSTNIPPGYSFLLIDPGLGYLLYQMYTATPQQSCNLVTYLIVTRRLTRPFRNGWHTSRSDRRQHCSVDYLRRRWWPHQPRTRYLTCLKQERIPGGTLSLDFIYLTSPAFVQSQR